tara:strand:+ start:20568 stop:20783 length:216 start_codon:yes stop_codon:yes gene_type:complete
MGVEQRIIRRSKILSNFFTYGFRGFTPFLNVCLSLDVELDSNRLSEFWRKPINDENLYNRLESIIEFLKHE